MKKNAIIGILIIMIVFMAAKLCVQGNELRRLENLPPNYEEYYGENQFGRIRFTRNGDNYSVYFWPSDEIKKKYEEESVSFTFKTEEATTELKINSIAYKDDVFFVDYYTAGINSSPFKSVDMKIKNFDFTIALVRKI